MDFDANFRITSGISVLFRYKKHLLLGRISGSPVELLIRLGTKNNY